MPFKRPGRTVVVVTDFGPEDDRLPRHELQTAGDDGIKPLKARALTLRVVKEFQAVAQLRQALNWQRRVPWPLKLARVIGQDPANWWRTVIIDAGSYDGIRTNMTVLTAEGLVGRVSEVGIDRSQVVMVGDPNCRFSAQVQDPRDKSVVAKGIISPSASTLDRLLVDLIYMPGGSLLKPGQLVTTSGDGGIFQKGIAVGQIVDVRTNDYGLNLEAQVKLAVNLNRLEQVWVMTQ